ncbi:MAG: D-amino acid aminotransferase [Gammaproteobacteria bacterium]|nr:D-amino acid aminotransferase [Gammaproteobacteria bacterium]MDH5729646.1 D-amino acid aminotransferase [Gammaproteobacteria bacterium]
MTQCYLNGEFLALDQAKISVLDRGFLLGDGVYEVIPAYHGKLFRLQDHLKRLQNSLHGIRLKNPLSTEQWSDVLQKLVNQNNPEEDQSVYLQVTRGVAKRDHAFPENTAATVFAMSNPIKYPTPDVIQNGVAAITLQDNRWLRCHIKAIALLPNVLLRQQAVDEGVDEAILLRDGLVTEGAASNVFVVKNNTICTPPQSPDLLPGITRDVVLELARSNDLYIHECPISEAELITADEIWLSSSTKEVLAVTELNKKKVGDGKPGAVWKTISSLYKAYKEKL